MKIYCKRSFKIAQGVSREAVASGSKEGYEFDWMIAMNYLKVAYGYATINLIEKIAQYIEEDSK